jgi:hypothetical protein
MPLTTKQQIEAFDNRLKYLERKFDEWDKKYVHFQREFYGIIRKQANLLMSLSRGK